MMNVVVYYVGVFVLVSLAIYLLLGLLFWLWKSNHGLEAPPHVAPESMPVLKPVPIPTKKQKNFIYKIIISIFEVREWKLVENWHYRLNETEIVIPKDFQFDGASIPRPFWAFLSPVGLLLTPGLIHDYAYAYDMLWCINKDGKIVKYQENAGKDYWDEIFRQVADDVNGFFFINFIAWLALFVGGNRAWKKHREGKKNVTPKPPVLS